MLRIYCDSNIYRYLNPTHPSYSLDLLDVFESLKDKMLFTFSDAHLDDLRSSPRNYAEADLRLMGKYVKDNYFMHDFIRDKETGPYLATPLEAFNSKDYVAYQNALDNPFDYDEIFSDIGDFKEANTFKKLIKSFLNLPVMALGNTIDQTKMDEKSKKWFNKILPNYHPMMSLGDLMKNTLPYSKSLLQDENELTELKRYIATYIHKDHFSFEKWGLGFNERLKNSAIGKTFLEMIDGLLTDNQKNNLYQKFNYAYNLLELYNITEERIGKKKKIKKFDLESLNTDALHAWYGSFSDYLITDDKGLQVKASIVYHLLKLPTKVLSSKDLINHKTFILGQEETFEKFYSAFDFDLVNSFQLYQRVDPFKEERVNTFKTTHSYFNYFNRLQIIKSKENTICAFYCDRESHATFFMGREIELIVNKLIDMLGNDDSNLGEYDFKEWENYKTEDTIRKWSNGNIQFTLLSSSKTWGNFLCLTLTFAKY